MLNSIHLQFWEFMVRFNCLVVCFYIFTTNAAASERIYLPLQISNHTFSVEIAHTQQLRTRGLMYRQSLDKNAGMLFVFPEIAYYGMWMKNTMMPLSVAFINEQGVILNIEDMEPYSLTAHHSSGPAKYALEMNRGWFAYRSIHPGDQVEGLKHVPVAQ